MLKHLMGAGVLTIVAFVIDFGVFPPTLDIHIHDADIVIFPRVITFWLLLAVAALWLLMAAFKFRHRSS
jgi:hypothetical protein